MRVEDIAVEVRPRQDWEAVDLGFGMARQWWRHVWAPFVLVTLSLAILLHLLLLDRPWLAALIVWWVKPLLDRIPLFVLSRALFGAVPSTSQTLRALPGLLSWHVLKALTVYRLDPSRSFNLPVWQLERMAGRARAERLRILHRTTAATPAKLTIACLHLEWALTLGFLGLLFIMLPEHLLADTWYAFTEEDAAWVEILSNALWLAALCVIEPFYVAGGFALYINRRSHLEAWDIDLAFRRLANRIAPAVAAKAAVVVVACVLTLALGTGFSERLLAQEQALGVQTQPNEREQARQLIENILSQPEFERSKEITWWLPKGWETEESEADDASSWFPLGLHIAQIMELLLWLIAAALIGVAVYYLAKRWPARLSSASRQRSVPAPDETFGLDIRPESLPADVPGQAWRFWRAGRRSDALSLLYRGALSNLVSVRGLRLPPSATEGDCLASARRAVDSLGMEAVDYFERVVRTWQVFAYAHRAPQDDHVQTLCSDWTQHFGTGT